MGFKKIIFLLLLCSLIAIMFKTKLINIVLRNYNEHMYPIKKIKIVTNLTNVNKMKEEVDLQIESFLEKENMNDKIYFVIANALSGGKRLRPIIIISTYNKLLNGNIPKNSKEYEAIMKISIMTEIIHCASLVIDDIMDNDLERRGEPSIHAQYGETYALLASLYMITLAVQLLIKSINEIDMKKENMTELLNLISDKLKDLSTGQYLDIEFSNDITSNLTKNINNDSLIEMIHKKTSSLFEICFCTSWIIANSNKDNNKDNINNVLDLARTFGLIYQIADDFEDIQQDMRRDGINYAIMNTPDKAKDEYFKLVEKFENDANKLNMYSDELKEIIIYLNKKVDMYYKYIKKYK